MTKEALIGEHNLKPLLSNACSSISNYCREVSTTFVLSYTAGC